MDLATKVLAFVVGVVAAFASYPYFNEYVISLLAFLGAAATGVIVGALTHRFLVWLLSRDRL